MLTIPSMPFYWRFKDSAVGEPGEPPGRVPFVFEFDERLDLVIEQRSPRLEALLADIYSRNTNVGYLQDGHSLIGGYGEDFWRFLSGLLASHPAQDVVEIGCGGCVLLERLRGQGRNVLGVDPSPFAAQAGARKGIRVLQEYFPPRALPMRPGLIFQMDVLEHVPDPLAFLRAQAECLTEAGLIVVNVPDCGPSIGRGDISMALHQHVNMFDETSLRRTLEASGLEVVTIEKSRYGAALFGAARKSEGCGAAIPAGRSRWERFEQQALRNIESFWKHLDAARGRRESLGFYMPQRAFPYLGIRDSFEGFRAFDNMNVWHGRYLDGLPVPIENHADLLARPVDHVFVMSLTFGNAVRDQLRRELPRTRVTTLDEIIG